MRLAFLGVFGFIVVSVAGTIANFFIPLNTLFSVPLLVLGVVLCAACRRRIFSGLGASDLVLCGILAFFASLYPLLKCYNYDTGLYHLQTIKWITGGTVPFGLANLHGRFGFNSSWFTVAAILEPPRAIAGGAFFTANAILLFYYCTAIFLSVKNRIARELNISTLFVIGTMLPCLIKLDLDLSSPTPDIPVMIACFLVLYAVIRSYEDADNGLPAVFAAMVIAAYGVTLKLSGVAFFFGIWLVAFVSFIAPRSRTRWLSRVMIDRMGVGYMAVMALVSFVVIAPWAAKGVVLSGSLAYPSALVYFPGLKWSVTFSQLVTEADSVKAWARIPFAPPHEVLASFDWIGPWFKRMLRKEIALIMVTASGIILVISALVAGRWRETPFSFIVPWAISMLGVLFWFLSAPDPRFGYGYLFSCAIIMLAYGVRRFDLINAFTSFVCSSRARAVVLALAGMGVAAGGVLLYVLSISEPRIVLLAGLLGRQQVNPEHWSVILMMTGTLYLAGGLMVALVMAIRLFNINIPDKVLKTGCCVALPLMLALNIIITHHSDIAEPVKLHQTVYSARITETGSTVFVPVGDDRCGDAPLPCTPYFSPAIRIENSHSGRPVMFWLPREKATSRTQ